MEKRSKHGNLPPEDGCVLSNSDNNTLRNWLLKR
jgi:hypothetical protein